MKLISSERDVEGATLLLSKSFDEISVHFDEVFSSLNGIESYNSPVATLTSRFVVDSGSKIVPELKRRFRYALATRNADTLYVYLSRILFEWDSSLVEKFQDELCECIRLGERPGEEHDAEAASLILRHGLVVPKDIQLLIPEILKKHPEVVARYGGL